MTAMPAGFDLTYTATRPDWTKERVTVPFNGQVRIETDGAFLVVMDGASGTPLVIVSAEADPQMVAVGMTPEGGVRE